ncbi:MAG: hypothetical protein FJX76_17700, partial [Armatimonadetes bacterium]|nr:hypothetical protein [Armatimonadota bacterium]
MNAVEKLQNSPGGASEKIPGFIVQPRAPGIAEPKAVRETTTTARAPRPSSERTKGAVERAAEKSEGPTSFTPAASKVDGRGAPTNFNMNAVEKLQNSPGGASEKIPGFVVQPRAPGIAEPKAVRDSAPAPSAPPSGGRRVKATPLSSPKPAAPPSGEQAPTAPASPPSAS